MEIGEEVECWTYDLRGELLIFVTREKMIT